MVNIGIAGRPRMFPGQMATYATAGDSDSLNDSNNYIETDIVGKGYPDATPIVVPPGSDPGAVVNTTPKVYEGIHPRHNTASGPPEQAGSVIMDLVNGVYKPRVQYTPASIEP